MSTSKAAAARLLIADDQTDVLEALRLLLKADGHQIETVTSPEAVIEALKGAEFDAILMDLNYTRDTTSGQEGLDLLGRIREIDRTLPIVVMTAWSSVGLAVETMRRGVRDFVEKPWDNAQVLTTLRTQVERGRAVRERARREAMELEDVREVGRGLLPKEIPQMPGYEISGVWRPVCAVGGDYFDTRKLNEHTLALSIGDAVGKGMPAALLMSNLQAAVKASTAEPLEPAELCRRVNRVMCGNVGADKFITFFYALLDAPGNRLVYTNAGHNAPLLVRRDGSVERLDRGGAVLGIFEDSPYDQAAVKLNPGDGVVLYTDGITEARNGEEEFGEERLAQLAVENRKLSAEALQDAVLSAVGTFSSNGFEDDATLIVLKAVGNGGPAPSAGTENW